MSFETKNPFSLLISDIQAEIDLENFEASELPKVSAKDKIFHQLYNNLRDNFNYYSDTNEEKCSFTNINGVKFSSILVKRSEGYPGSVYSVYFVSSHGSMKFHVGSGEGMKGEGLEIALKDAIENNYKIHECSQCKIPNMNGSVDEIKKCNGCLLTDLCNPSPIPSTTDISD